MGFRMCGSASRGLRMVSARMLTVVAALTWLGNAARFAIEPTRTYQRSPTRL